MAIGIDDLDFDDDFLNNPNNAATEPEPNNSQDLDNGNADDNQESHVKV